MTPPGYTQTQAQRIKTRIDRHMAAVEDHAHAMRRAVGDVSVTTASVEIQLEELREVAHELRAIVDRRTR